MSSPLTLGATRAALANIIFGDRDEPTFLKVVNEAVSRLYDMGKWEGLVSVIEFENPNGFITLPRRYSTILAVQLGGAPRTPYSRYYEYTPGGPGQLDETAGLVIITDQGFFPTQNVFTEPSTLTLSAPSDTSTTVRVFGIDDTGKEVFDNLGAPGEELAHGVESTATFSEISAVIKEETAGFVTLSAGSDVLSVYEPNETTPSYHRYKVGAGDDRTYRCLCKRRFVPLYNDSDIIYPGNLGALKMAVQAVSAENASLIEKAKEYWATCFQLLDLEKGANRGGAEIRFRVNPGGAGARPLRKFL